MKINEKNLCAYAVSATPVDKEGYLNKRGEVNKNFQRRYFVLKGNLLFYFDKRGDKEPLGVIILEGCTIELAEDEEQFCFKILFHGTNNRTYILGAESQESMEQWMKALACSSYDYMKLMVAELQRQLDDIEGIPSEIQAMEYPVDSYESGNSKFYIAVDTPVPVPVTQVQSSPVAPPRTRHNPFNKPEINAQHRPHSMRPSNPNRSDEATRYSDPGGIAQKNCVITFRELHNSYGRPILQDFNIWKRQQRDKADNAVGNLISL